MARTRVGVLASGRGSNFQALVDAVKQGALDVDLALLLCNVPGAQAIERAQAAGVPVAVIDHRDFGKDREAWERAAVKALAEHRVDLVVFAGFMRLVTPFFISHFPDRILNIHPSLLPAFPGAQAQRDAVEHGAKVTGLTIHFVDASLDGGPIVLQKALPVRDDDSEESLAARILEWEHRLYPLAVKLFAERRLRVDGRRVTVDWTGVERPPVP